MNQLIELWKQFSDLTFWENILNLFRSFGPLAPVGLAALESVIPPIPLIGIVALNIVAYGTFLGAFYSWIGTCIGCTMMFFFWRCVFQRLVRWNKTQINAQIPISNQIIINDQVY